MRWLAVLGMMGLGCGEASQQPQPEPQAVTPSCPAADVLGTGVYATAERDHVFDSLKCSPSAGLEAIGRRDGTRPVTLPEPSLTEVQALRPEKPGLFHLVLGLEGARLSVVDASGAIEQAILLALPPIRELSQLLDSEDGVQAMCYSRSSLQLTKGNRFIKVELQLASTRS